MPKKGILLVNLGTPDSPTWNGLRKYLNQFLTDRRVIDLPWIFRNILFKCIVVPIRSRRVAKLYQRLWMDEGSPLKVYGERLTKGIQERLGSDYHVKLAMRYQKPTISRALQNLLDQNVEDITIFPLFPQYSSATTGSVFEEVMRIIKTKEQIPNISFVNSYYDNMGMIELFADNARKRDLSQYDHFIFSFHGVPKRYLKKENNYCQCNGECCHRIVPQNQFCYSAQCHSTAFAIAEKLKLTPDSFTISFQSRFGPDEWIQPYTDKAMKEQLEKGNKKILIFSPAFVADCLETVIEIGCEYKEEFIEAGGEKIDLVESLNDDPKWMDVVADLVR